MSERRTVLIVCARAPRRLGSVPAVRVGLTNRYTATNHTERESEWRCSWCGKRVKVVA